MNAPKHEFTVQWGGSGAFIAKNSEATSWHELLHQFGPFCTEFRKATNGPKCTKFVRNAPKHEFRVQWGGLGALVKKNSDATLRHELLLAHNAPSFVSQPNGPKCTKIVRTHQNMSLVSNGVDRVCSLRKSFRRDFVARTFAPVRPVLL